MNGLSRYDLHNKTCYNAGKHKAYICSLCGQPTTRDDSASRNGLHLVCMKCIERMAWLFDKSAGSIVIELQEGAVKDAISYDNREWEEFR